jgi:hypothetical protein
MSRFFDDLEAQLHRAASAQTAASRLESARPSPGRRRLGSTLRALPVLLAVAIAVAVVAVVLAGHGGGPSAPASGRPPQLAQLLHQPKSALRREDEYLQAAAKRTACESAGYKPGKQYVTGTPGAAWTSQLAVLRRPAAAGDVPSRQTIQGISGIYRGSVRRARVSGGAGYYIIPTRGDGLGRIGITPRCVARIEAALKRSAPNIPVSLRAKTLALGAALLAREEQPADAGVAASVCLAYAGRESGGVTCGFSAGGLTHGMINLTGPGMVAGVVPDGVASVTVRLPGLHGAPPRTPTADVTGNVFVVRAAGVMFGTRKGTEVIWRSAAGTVIRTITQPFGGSVFCQDNPGACGAGGDAYASAQVGAAKPHR